MQKIFCRWVLIAAITTTASCADRDPTQHSPLTTPTASSAAASIAPSQDEAFAGDTLDSKVAAGGIATTYRAYFDGTQLKRIAETRRPDATSQSGAYDFYGARLVEYRGAALSGPQQLALKFDMQGGLTSAAAESGEVPQNEVDKIRQRAQLLRSHALAQRAVRQH